MRWFYVVGAGVLVAVVLIVLFTGVGDNIEGRLLGWLARNAR